MRKKEFDYYRGREARQYSYYIIPQLLIHDKYFKDVSTDAKLLYGILLNRMNMSIKNKWYDDQKRVFIYFTIEQVMEQFRCSKVKAVKLMSELDSIKGVGLIERIKQGQGKPDRVYVKHFARLADGGDDFDDIDEPQDMGNDTSGSTESDTPRGKQSNTSRSTEKDTPRGKQNDTLRSTENILLEVNDSQEYKNCTSGSKEFVPQEVKKTEPLEVQKMYPNNLDINKPDINNYLSFQSKLDYKGIEEIDCIRRELQEKIEYEILTEIYTLEELDQLVEIIVEVLITTKPHIHISGADYDIGYVQERFSQIRREHIEYIIESLRKNNSKVRNVTGYLMSVIFYAPLTIEQKYRLEVNHDMHASSYSE